MKKAQSHKNATPKIWWSLSLFVNVVLTILAIFTQNIPGCIAAIIFGIYLSKYGDPIIFEEYNIKRKEKVNSMRDSGSKH